MLTLVAFEKVYREIILFRIEIRKEIHRPVIYIKLAVTETYNSTIHYKNDNYMNKNKKVSLDVSYSEFNQKSILSWQ